MKRIKIITGGIGSGKSYVCEKLRKRGIEVYDCDAAAKRIMREDPDVRQQLINLIGEEAYTGNELNKAAVAKFLLQSEYNTQAINAIVHPAVAADFLASDYEWMESAIYYEADFGNVLKQVSSEPISPYVICVSAPTKVRIRRIMKRDNITEEKALEWINKQIPQEEKERRSDFVIHNA
ncbi:MAG: dephospho-CoA kinase [Prevotellaceae bacterium]|nr:dephospho-CoA kinase [Prevotellaceae bacterium]